MQLKIEQAFYHISNLCSCTTDKPNMLEKYQIKKAQETVIVKITPSAIIRSLWLQVSDESLPL